MRIFVVCDSPYLFTGLARVNRHVIKGLRDSGHEVILGAWGWDQLAYPLGKNSQWMYEDNENGYQYVAFPLSKDPKKLLIQTYEILKSIPCDVLLTIGDYWNFAGFELLKSKLDYGYKWISYYTIESSPINEDFLESFNYMDEIMAPSLFGKKVVEDSTGLKCHHVPYGIDHDTFYPLSDEEREAERTKRELTGKIRFINVCKNQNRKNIPAFLEALKIANKKDNRIVGYLHTNIDKKVQSQVNVRNIIKRLGIEDIISVPNKKISLDIGCSDADLRIEYGCSDALVLSSVAEGFGFPLLEAQACGIPAIASDCSSMSELCFEKGLLAKCMKYYGSMEQEVGIVDVEDLAEKMCKISSFEVRKEKMSEFFKGFLWNKTNARIENVISSMSDEVAIPVEEV